MIPHAFRPGTRFGHCLRCGALEGEHQPAQIVTTEWPYRNHILRPGTELTVEGIRGRVRFLQHVAVVDTGVEWVDVINDRGSRAIRPERIKVIHHKRKVTA